MTDSIQPGDRISIDNADLTEHFKSVRWDIPRWMEDLAACHGIDVDDIRSVTVDVNERDDHLRPTSLAISLELHESADRLVERILRESGLA